MQTIFPEATGASGLFLTGFRRANEPSFAPNAAEQLGVVIAKRQYERVGSQLISSDTNKDIKLQDEFTELEFDGETDSIFHPFTHAGQAHMEYVKDHGTFPGVPVEFIMQGVDEAYPHLSSNMQVLSADASLEKEFYKTFVEAYKKMGNSKKEKYYLKKIQ